MNIEYLNMIKRINRMVLTKIPDSIYILSSKIRLQNKILISD